MNFNGEIVKEFAQSAAQAFARGAFVFVGDLEPDDATLYRIFLVPPRDAHPGEWIVGIVNFGTSGYWARYYMTGGYAAQTWGKNNDHSGEVIALFLNELDHALQEQHL